jgi:phosphoribosylanthranilate isomerase
MTVQNALPLFERFRDRLVALTADADDRLLSEIAEKLKPAAIQLTANESPEMVAKIKSRLGVSILKSLHLPVEGSRNEGEEIENPEGFANEILKSMDRYTSAGADGFVLDTSVPKVFGGSGKKSDWKIAKKIIDGADYKIFLAGGINPENAEDAARLNPYAIDLASGVEVSPGVKSKEKIDLLFTALKRASTINAEAGTKKL